MNSDTRAVRGVAPSRILGVSPWSRDLRDEIDRVAPFSSSVLITGPSGTGKELVARELHQRSPRCEERLIPVDCASVTGELMASQLFGHHAGAFTGANYSALGCFRAADRGTLFLDEIGELELSLQSKLLRVLQERVVVPVGGHEGHSVNVRVIAATNRDLKQEIVAGRFREDLYFRLNVVTIRTASLTQRPDDITTLAESFLDQLARDGMPRKTLSPGACEALSLYSWPGNVRQLQNVLEQAVIHCDGPLLTLQFIQRLLDHLNEETSRKRVITEQPTCEPHVSPAMVARPLPEDTLAAEPKSDQQWLTLSALERSHILGTLEHTYYNRSAAARLLGISRQALIRKMKKLEIKAPRLPGKLPGGDDSVS